MRSLLTLFLVSAVSAWPAAGPADFNGRWILKVDQEPRGRVWWLKVSGAGTPALAGDFVGAPGGQVDRIPRMTVSPGGELIWEFDAVYDRDKKGSSKGIYRARLQGANLTGWLEVDGQTRLRFQGRRAPEIRDTDDGKWVKQKPVELFNGKDLEGWTVTAANRSIAEWVVEQGVLKNGKGKAPDIATNTRFWNFDLHIEFRVAQHSNSGIGLRGRYEVQIFGDHGEAPTKHGNGALYSRIVPAINATLPPESWQTFDIRFIGREVTVVLNGKTLIDKRDVEGYTAMATDPNEDQPGPLSLQGDHGPVEFRKVTITPLVRGK